MSRITSDLRAALLGKVLPVDIFDPTTDETLVPAGTPFTQELLDSCFFRSNLLNVLEKHELQDVPIPGAITCPKCKNTDFRKIQLYGDRLCYHRIVRYEGPEIPPPEGPELTQVENICLGDEEEGEDTDNHRWACQVCQHEWPIAPEDARKLTYPGDS